VEGRPGFEVVTAHPEEDVHILSHQPRESSQDHDDELAGQ
jgi:hypothetical protein